MEKRQLENLIVVIYANESCLVVGASCQGTRRPRFFNPFLMHVCLFKDIYLFHSGKILAVCIYAIRINLLMIFSFLSVGHVSRGQYLCVILQIIIVLSDHNRNELMPPYRC